MAIWMEIQCDIKSDGPPTHRSLDPFCYSNNTLSPGVLARSDRQGMMDALYSLETVAKKKGWRKRQDGSWECPNCRTYHWNSLKHPAPKEG